jgi:hypothetical protein
MSKAKLEERLLSATGLYVSAAHELQEVIKQLERYGVPGFYLDQIQSINFAIEIGADLNRLLIAKIRIKEMRKLIEQHNSDEQT